MLGHMVHKYFKCIGFNVSTIEYRYPSNEFKNYIESYSGDYIINCIGSIPQKVNQFDINFELPICLDNLAKCNIIHAGTDCEMDNDDYGISKRKASDYIKTFSVRTKILKTSIIGPELNSKHSLFEWFMNSKDDVYGYTKAMWSGNTTYEWAKQCEKLILNWNNYKIETILQGECISKFDLLNKINFIFNKKINILPIEKGIDKCLIGNINTAPIDIQLSELKNFYNKDYNEYKI